MKLILFAWTSEAAATIAKLNGLPDETSKRPIWGEGVVPTLYHYPEGTIVITDIGLHAATAALARHRKGHTEVWNVGFAGVLHDRLPLLELMEIQEVGKYCPYSHEIVDYHLPRITLPNHGISLISSDAPIHTSEARTSLAQRGFDLVDMEGYAIAYLASHFNLPCKLWKVVSDFASPGGLALIRKHANALSEKIAALF